MAINGWQLIERVGAGGMGEVWRAHHARLGVGALKLLREELLADRDARARFRREARTLRRIEGLCTGRIIDVRIDGAHPYIVTEYIAGPTLRRHIAEEGPITDEDLLLAFTLGLADALVALHDAGVVHRDLTATNVLMADTGPKVVDFGIAGNIDPAHVTTTVFSMGTPGWMSPEQIRGGHVGGFSDVFCWGLLVCFAATGRNVFGVGSPDALLYRIVHEQPTLPALPRTIAPMVRQALEKNPTSRPTARHVLRSIERTTDTTTRAVLDETWRRQRFHTSLPAGSLSDPSTGERSTLRRWLRRVGAPR